MADSSDLGCAVRSDGTLKDASEIEWHFDEDDDLPIAPTGATSSATHIPTDVPMHPFFSGQPLKSCYAQALGVVGVGSLSVELSGRIRVRNGRPSCCALLRQNRGVRRGYRGSKEVRQSA